VNLDAGAMRPAQRKARQATAAVARIARRYLVSKRPYLPLRQIHQAAWPRPQIRLWTTQRPRIQLLATAL